MAFGPPPRCGRREACRRPKKDILPRSSSDVAKEVMEKISLGGGVKGFENDGLGTPPTPGEELGLTDFP